MSKAKRWCGPQRKIVPPIYFKECILIYTVFKQLDHLNEVTLAD